MAIAGSCGRRSMPLCRARRFRRASANKALAGGRRLDGILIGQRGVDMGTQVTLPLWAAFILTLLAVWAAVDRILVPSVRWAVRRRTNRAIEDLNTRLKLRIQPFKLTAHQVLIERL